MSFTARNRSLRTALIAAVLLALVLAQALGLMHGIVHFQRATTVVGATAVDTPHVAASKTDSGTWLQALFAGHDRGGCELYDQLSHADVLCDVPALLLPSTPPSTPPQGHGSWQLAQQIAGFLARGPPALS
jgi:hypothetical protein